jgi:hypothetical protein
MMVLEEFIPVERAVLKKIIDGRMEIKVSKKTNKIVFPIP